MFSLRNSAISPWNFYEKLAVSPWNFKICIRLFLHETKIMGIFLHLHCICSTVIPICHLSPVQSMFFKTYQLAAVYIKTTSDAVKTQNFATIQKDLCLSYAGRHFITLIR